MRALCFLLLLLLLPLRVIGDGLPYYRDGELIGEAIILSMNDEQFKEVDIHREVTLTGAQRAMLARLFKKVPEKLEVVSSSFNDSREDASMDEVHCIWLRDRMLAITYNADQAASHPDHYREHAFFTSVADSKRLVVSSSAKIYKGGKEVSTKDVYGMIDALAAEAAKEKPGFYIDLRFSIPPPSKDVGEANEAWKKLFAAFQVYGETKGVVVAGTW